MNLCSDGHGEVCYEARDCPACAAMIEKDKEIAKQDDIITEHEGTIEQLNREVENLQ